jgi:hypothetical protein
MLAHSISRIPSLLLNRHKKKKNYIDVSSSTGSGVKDYTWIIQVHKARQRLQCGLGESI